MLRQLFRKIENFIHLTSSILMTTAGIALMAMMLLVAVDVLGRYLFALPITGSSDLMELLMVIIVFFSLAYCAEKKGHTRVDIVYNYFSIGMQKNFDVFTSLASLVIFALISWQLTKRVWDIVQHPPGPSTDLLHIPHAPFILLANIGSILLCLEIIIQIVHLILPSLEGEGAQ